MAEIDDKTSVVETDSQKTSIENANKKSNNIQYKIFDFFKVHPSFFITIASAFVAIISVFLNLAAFLNANSYLTFFNLDNTIYKQSIQFVYFIAISLIFLLATILFQSFITKTFESYLPYKKTFLLYKYILKNIKNKQKHSKKELKKVEKKISEFDKLKQYEDTVKPLKEKIVYLKENDIEIKHEYNLLKKDKLKCRISYLTTIVMSCLLMWVVLYLISSLMLSFDLYDWRKTLLFSLLFSTIIVLANAIENWFLICVVRLNRKEIRTDSLLDSKIRHTKYSNENGFPIHSLFVGNFKYIFSDSNCKKFITSTILCLFVLIFASSWLGSRSASRQKEFFVVDIDNQTYAIVYNNGENLALEKVDITDDTLTIYTNHQKIISSKNIDMKKYTFDDVEIIREENNFIDVQFDSKK